MYSSAVSDATVLDKNNTVSLSSYSIHSNCLRYSKNNYSSFDWVTVIDLCNDIHWNTRIVVKSQFGCKSRS